MDQIFFIVLVVMLPLGLYEAFGLYWERRKDRLAEENARLRGTSAWARVEDFLKEGWNFDPFMSTEKICRSRTWRRRTPSALIELEISGSESVPSDVKLLAFAKCEGQDNESWEASLHAEFEDPEDLLRFLKTDLVDRILKVRLGAKAMVDSSGDEGKPSTDESEPPAPR